MKKTAQKATQGFTLVELLVVIAIIAILAAIVVLIVNPLELTRRGRDATRLTDLSSLQNAINVAVQEATGSGTGGILCVGSSGGVACSGRSDTDTRVSDGTGWIKVNLKTGNPSLSIPTLPVDPVNSTALHYSYATNAAQDMWEINTVLESAQYTGKMTTDGGNNPAAYEVGSDLSIIP